MKNELREILEKLVSDAWIIEEDKVRNLQPCKEYIEQTEQQILEWAKSKQCGQRMPIDKDLDYYKWEESRAYCNGWNDCREQAVKNIEDKFGDK